MPLFEENSHFSTENTFFERFFEKSLEKIWWFHEKLLPLHRISEITRLMHFKRSFGEMAEWSIASVLKTDVLRGTGGSNPSLSAKVADYQRLFFFTAIFDCAIKLYNGSADFCGYVISISLSS